jgi:hypothetical protein
MTEADIKDGIKLCSYTPKDGSKRRVKPAGDGYEIQGLLVAITRKPGKRW